MIGRRDGGQLAAPFFRKSTDLRKWPVARRPRARPHFTSGLPWKFHLHPALDTRPEQVGLPFGGRLIDALQGNKFLAENMKRASRRHNPPSPRGTLHRHTQEQQDHLEKHSDSTTECRSAPSHATPTPPFLAANRLEWRAPPPDAALPTFPDIGTGTEQPTEEACPTASGCSQVCAPRRRHWPNAPTTEHSVQHARS